MRNEYGVANHELPVDRFSHDVDKLLIISILTSQERRIIDNGIFLYSMSRRYLASFKIAKQI